MLKLEPWEVSTSRRWWGGRQRKRISKGDVAHSYNETVILTEERQSQFQNEEVVNIVKCRS